ncbi:MAG: aminotransferase class V-fold PLP-dependent enzyme, partial [Anaerolineales bacterium]|nr:aminotransferase class V-fold PLP-dependent enzyme [Anaerolineales bacterium]
MSKSEALRQQILALVQEYYEAEHSQQTFTPGETEVPVSGRVFDAAEMVNLVDSSLEFWLTTGRYADQFEQDFARWMNVRHAILCNSGSSANLLALSALTSPKLEDRQLKPGDEVITVAAGFPTTVNPIVQNQLTPVFLDIELGTYNVNVDLLETAVSPHTKAIMIAHTLGNPFNLDAVLEVANKHNLWLIEDNCDAVGALYNGRLTGSFGHLSTVSFYPAHHITMG